MGTHPAVESLANTIDPRVKAWMLRKGYRNSLMDEYLAFTCARTGDLQTTLQTSDPDDALLKGACEIICALIQGGPAEEMKDYDDGAEATRLLIHHLECRQTLSLRQFNVAWVIRRYVKDPKARWNERPGWTEEIRSEISAAAKAIMARPDWRERALAGLQEENESRFSAAAWVARTLGIDPWPWHFERQQQRRSDAWYRLMQTKDPERIDRVLALAGEQLDLDVLAKGPRDEPGLGPDFAGHRALCFIVQDLGRFPGKGWPFIRASLESPPVRSRNMALRVLDAWGRENWPEGTEAVLRRALEREPNEQVMERIRKVLTGKPSG